MSTPAWFVYFVRTAGNALYCGITTNLERRFALHQQGRGAKALRGKGPLKLVWSAAVPEGKRAALQVEYRIKRLPKAQKEALVQGELAIALLQRRWQIGDDRTGQQDSID